MILKSNSSNSKEVEEFVLLHRPQLESSAVPEHLWEILAYKLKNQIFDAGKYFQMCQCIVCDEENPENKEYNWEVVLTKEGGLNVSESDCIFLIDHAWTYQPSEARSSLLECPGLTERMCGLMNIDVINLSDEEKIKSVLKEMWKFNGTYKMLSAVQGNAPSEAISLWYVMDEFGSRIQHDGEPNSRVVPIYYHPNRCCYSILFLIKNVECGQEITRNYVETPPVDSVTRDAQMLPWFPEDLSEKVSHLQEEPHPDFFESERQREILPSTPPEVRSWSREGPLRVFTDYDQVKLRLTDSRFELVFSEGEADVLWLSSHFKDFQGLAKKAHMLVNQFPCESLLTVKDLLAVVSRRIRCDGNNPQLCDSFPYAPWYIPTYCLKRELAKFASYFQYRQKNDLDNTWIVKPWNLARGMDHSITDNLNHILRLPSTGPKIAQKYLHHPVLFARDDIKVKVKFDLRFIALLLGVKPLRVALYRKFWIRFANKEFTLDGFDDDQKHFTVNNYNESFLLQMTCDDFVSGLESQYPNHAWSSTFSKIQEMVRDVFEGATKFSAPAGIPHSPVSRAAYGFDVMLDWASQADGSLTMQPKLLEINFNSDCKRACEYYPDFFNQLFRVMFLDERDGEHFIFL